MINDTIVSHVILTPTSNGYQPRSILSLLNAGGGQLRAFSNYGSAPLHFITERGPFQDGETLIDMRYNSRTSQVVIERSFPLIDDYVAAKRNLLDSIRANRAFKLGEDVTQYIYRRIYAGGSVVRGTDGEIENGSTLFYAARGRFLDFGGLLPGDHIMINGVQYFVATCDNDYAIELTAPYAGATTTSALWEYIGGPTYRDLYFVPEQGPQFNEQTDQAQYNRAGYREVLRMISYDPFFYGLEQSQSWELEVDVGDLIFDGVGAWFGATSGVGRWLFYASTINKTVEVAYHGTVKAKPSAVIIGPADNIQISNIDTNVIIGYTEPIGTGETLTIDSLDQTALLDDGVTETDVANYITGDISAFSLEPDRGAPDGINNINISFDSASPFSRAVLYWRNRFDGD